MADDSPKQEYGVVVRLIANVLTFTIGLGALWPVGQWALGDSKGYGADLRDGLLQGAIVGILMTFLGEPLVRWIDRVLRRLRGKKDPEA